eukprot:COSAG06_NODE_519_length_14752_cov_130.649840_13_plen_159_part_00
MMRFIQKMNYTPVHLPSGDDGGTTPAAPAPPALSAPVRVVTSCAGEPAAGATFALPRNRPLPPLPPPPPPSAVAAAPGRCCRLSSVSKTCPCKGDGWSPCGCPPWSCCVLFPELCCCCCCCCCWRALAVMTRRFVVSLVSCSARTCTHSHHAIEQTQS